MVSRRRAPHHPILAVLQLINSPGYLTSVKLEFAETGKILKSRFLYGTNVAMDVSRASLLRGHLFGAKQAVRPPWALTEMEFTDHCERCDDCVDACPEGILEAGSAGFPTVEFALGACTFCGDCADVCRSGAFGPRDAAPWRVSISITEECMSAKGVTCRVCEGKCDQGAIAFSFAGAGGKPDIDTAVCNGCGACVGPCPSDAINLQPQSGSH